MGICTERGRQRERELSMIKKRQERKELVGGVEMEKKEALEGSEISSVVGLSEM